MTRFLHRIVAIYLLLALPISFAADEITNNPVTSNQTTVTRPAEKEPREKELVAKTGSLPPEEQKFVIEMAVKHALDATKITQWLEMAETKQSIIDAMDRPAEGVLSWKKYSKIFLTDKRLKEGLVFWKKYHEDIARAEKTYGVPAEMIVAIIGVETFYGRIKGNYRVLDALYTLAFHYPKRAKFFRSELGLFFRLTVQQGWQPETRIGSYAGAMGYGQFMPSSYLSYGVDFDNDGSTDLANNPIDAIGSVAHYFKKHGWRTGEDVIFRARLTNWKASKLSGSSTKLKYQFGELKNNGVVTSAKIPATSKVSLMTFDQESRKEYWLGLHNFYVISRYNHSHMYSMAAYQLSQQLKKHYQYPVKKSQPTKEVIK